MSVVVIDQGQVAELLPMDECIAAVSTALAALARGEAVQPLRPVLWLPDRRGALGLMPAALEPLRAMAVKVVSVFPGNEGTDLDAHQGFVALFDTERGRLLCLADATEITALRTAATSAVATDLLARADAAVLALLGSGTQARTHLEAMTLVRPIDQVRVWSRTPEHAAAFAVRHGGSVEVVAVPTVAEAVGGADVVCTTTASPAPILEGAWLTPGVHVNAVGSSVPFAREVDGETMRRSTVFVDRRESTLAEAGDFLLARDEGLIGDEDIAAEIGEVLIGLHPGRTSAEEITLFESTGLGVEDLAAVHHVYARAREEGVGTVIELGGRRHAD